MIKEISNLFAWLWVIALALLIWAIVLNIEVRHQSRQIEQLEKQIEFIKLPAQPVNYPTVMDRMA